MSRYKNSKSPFDYLIWNGITLVGLECKLLRARKSTNPKSLPFNRVPHHQREGLLELDQMKNSRGVILVNFRWIDHKKGKLFALPITEFINLEYALDRKSIPLEYFGECTQEIPRYEKGWDLRLLL